LDNWTRVGNRGLARDDQSEIGQLTGKPLLMRVQNAAQHQFAAGIDEFDFHSGYFCSLRATCKVESSREVVVTASR
jgi:hypothetical protein